MKHINRPVPDAGQENPRLPEALVALVTSMLQKDPSLRPDSYKLIQVRAMQIAAELPPPELMARIAWCRHESKNTTDQAGRCSSCQKPYAGSERPARFHVDIVGWHRNGADDEIAAYIGKAVGRPQEVVAPLLRDLPFRAAFKAPRERARRMQKAFYEMGADVQLEPADEARGGDKQIKDLPFKAYWPPQPDGVTSDDLSRPPGALDTRSLRSVALPARPALGTITAIGLGVLSLVLAIALVVERSDEPPVDIAPTAAAIAVEPPPAERAPPATERAQAAISAPSSSGWDGSFGGTEPKTDAVAAKAPIEEAADPAEATVAAMEPALEEPAIELRSARFAPTLGQNVDGRNAQAALVVLEDVASSIDRTLSLQTSALQLRFTDAPLIDDVGARSWPAAQYAPVLEFPLGGASGPTEASFEPAAKLLYARSAVRRAGGASVPPWLLVGLSLVLEQGPAGPMAVTDLVQQGQAAPISLPIGLGANPPSTELLLRSFASWLVDEHGWKKVARLLESLKRTGNLEGAFVTAFGSSPTELEQDWLAATTGVE
jgi:hypothetical protein